MSSPSCGADGEAACRVWGADGASVERLGASDGSELSSAAARAAYSADETAASKDMRTSSASIADAARVRTFRDEAERPGGVAEALTATPPRTREAVRREPARARDFNEASTQGTVRVERSGCPQGSPFLYVFRGFGARSRCDLVRSRA